MKNELGRPLPFADDPYLGESFFGFALRMSNRNGIEGLHWLLKLLNRERLRHLTKQDRPYVEYVFGARAGSLETVTLRSAVIAGDRRYFFLKQLFSVPYVFRSHYPQLCVHCVQELGHLRAIWEFSLYIVCAMHGCFLTERCDGCGRFVRWQRALVGFCICGRKYSPNLEVVGLDDPARQLAAVVEDCCSAFSRPVGLTSFGGRATVGVSLDCLFRLIFAFGVLEHSESTVDSGKPRRVLRNGEALPLIARAQRRLAALSDSDSRGEDLSRLIYSAGVKALIEDCVAIEDRRLALNIARQCLGQRDTKMSLRYRAVRSQMELF